MYHSTLGLIVIKKKKKDCVDEVEGLGVALLQPPLRLSDAALALAPTVRLPRAGTSLIRKRPPIGVPRS